MKSKGLTSLVTEKRKEFDKMPVFLQAGLYNYEKYANVRNQSFYPKLYAFNILKKQGNELFTQAHFDKSLRKYEEALSIYRCIRSQNYRWREEGIEDTQLEKIEEFGKNREEKKLLSSCKLTCYLNIAACALKLKDATTTRYSCEEALKLDSINSKAYYRLAKSKLLGPKLKREDYISAKEHLNKALQYDSENTTIIKGIEKIEKEMKLAQEKDDQEINKFLRAEGKSHHGKTEDCFKIDEINT